MSDEHGRTRRRADAPDLTSVDVERQHAERSLPCAETECAWTVVDLDAAQRHAREARAKQQRVDQRKGDQAASAQPRFRTSGACRWIPAIVATCVRFTERLSVSMTRTSVPGVRPGSIDSSWDREFNWVVQLNPAQAEGRFKTTSDRSPGGGQRLSKLSTICLDKYSN
jgi:hypothetical protein